KRAEMFALDCLRRRMIDFKDMNPGKLAHAPSAAIKSCSKDHELRCTTSNCGPYRGIDRCCAQCYFIGPHPGKCKFESFATVVDLFFNLRQSLQPLRVQEYPSGGIMEFAYMRRARIGKSTH